MQVDVSYAWKGRDLWTAKFPQESKSKFVLEIDTATFQLLWSTIFSEFLFCIAC